MEVRVSGGKFKVNPTVTNRHILPGSWPPILRASSQMRLNPKFRNRMKFDKMTFAISISERVGIYSESLHLTEGTKNSWGGGTSDLTEAKKVVYTSVGHNPLNHMGSYKKRSLISHKTRVDNQVHYTVRVSQHE